jgi:methionyl-tRNA formyltransferase
MSSGLAKPEPQDAAGVTFAPKIDRENARLDWSRDALTLSRQVRAFDPAPGAWTMHGDVPLKLFGAVPAPERGEPGSVLATGERLVIACGDGALAVREAQPAGRTRLLVADWVRGRGIAAGARLG